MSKPDPMGGTFAERAAATAGASSFTEPTPANAEPEENSTFASRANGGRKAVKADSDVVEDKAVKKAAVSKKS